MKKKKNSKRKKTRSKVGGISSNLSFEKNASIITDNEYEVNSENSSNCRNCSDKKRCR